MHYDTIEPSIQRGKDVYVEWPLCSTLRDAERLMRLAGEKNVRMIVGLQGRFHPAFKTLKALIGQGKIGKVLSSRIAASGGTTYRTRSRPRWDTLCKQALAARLSLSASDTVSALVSQESKPDHVLTILTK